MHWVNSSPKNPVTLGTSPIFSFALRLLPKYWSKIAVLYDAGQAVLSTFDLDEVLQHILTIAHDYFHLRNVAIVLLDRQSQQLYVRSQIGWDEGEDRHRLAIGEGITGAAALKKRPVFTPMLLSIRATSAPPNPHARNSPSL